MYQPLDDDLAPAFFDHFADSFEDLAADNVRYVGAKVIEETLASTVGDLREASREVWVEAIKKLGNEFSEQRVERWVCAFEKALGVTFKSAKTPAARAAPGRRTSDFSRVRQPRFTIPGTIMQTLGETLVRRREIDGLTLPRTLGAYIVLASDGKMTKRQLKRLMRDVYVWTIEKYGSVNGDLIYYRKIASLIHQRWGENILPDYGKHVKGEDRDLAMIIKVRFENGRRRNARNVYKNVRVRKINLCAEGAALVEKGLHVHIDDDSDGDAEMAHTEDGNDGDDGGDDNAVEAFVLKNFNPQRDARRALRNVYVGDPVLELATDQESYDESKAKLQPGQWLLLPSSWFDYMDKTAMPQYVTAVVTKKVRADKPSIEVKMIGDDKPHIHVKYYVEKHPQAYEGMEEMYLLNSAVKFLAAEPPTM